MTILTVDRKEFEKKLWDRKPYKSLMLFSTNIFPSDPTGSLDDFYFYGRYNG